MVFGSRSSRGSNGLASVSTPRNGGQLNMLGLADTGRNNAVAVLGEFVGTFLFLFWSFVGTQISNTPKPRAGADPNTNNLLFASLAFGLSLMVNVWAFFRVTGGLFNPSVTLALFLVGGLPAIRCLLVFLAQIAGGLCAAAVASALFPGPLNVETTLGGGTSISQGLFIEMFLTAQLVFVIIMLAVVKHRSTFLAPVGIGLTFFLTELCGIFYTGGSLNFARSLGPAAVNHHFPGYFWIYFVGPLLGSLLAAGFFKLLNSLRYETCNPGQDSGGAEEEKLMHTRSGSTAGNAAGNGSGIPFKENPHERNVSGATAVNRDAYINHPGEAANQNAYINHPTQPANDHAYINPLAQSANDNAYIDPLAQPANNDLYINQPIRPARSDPILHH